VTREAGEVGDFVSGVRPSGTVTFLFTDIECSTRLRDEVVSFARATVRRGEEP
jgi:hypothetical protein